MSEDMEFDSLDLPSYDVITILLDGVQPRIDIGEVDPLYAMALFQQAADELRLMITDPKITSCGEEMVAVFSLFDEDDEDDD